MKVTVRFEKDGVETTKVFNANTLDDLNKQVEAEVLEKRPERYWREGPIQ